jgi:hypothetical protein
VRAWAFGRLEMRIRVVLKGEGEGEGRGSGRAVRVTLVVRHIAGRAQAEARALHPFNRRRKPKRCHWVPVRRRVKVGDASDTARRDIALVDAAQRVGAAVAPGGESGRDALCT